MCIHEDNWRKVTSALGYGDGITEPQISHENFIVEMECQRLAARDWWDSQNWLNDCAAAGHPQGEDCWEHDPTLRALADRAALDRVRALVPLLSVRYGPDNPGKGPHEQNLWASGVVWWSRRVEDALSDDGA